MEKIYNKLVRDNIPNIIANDNEEVFTSTLTIEEYQEALLNKLQEETTETKKEILEELADVLEVLKSIADASVSSKAFILCPQLPSVSVNSACTEAGLLAREL